MQTDNYPLIEALKSHKLYISGDQFITLPTSTPFGNLNLNWMEILVRFDCVNDLIIDLYKDFYYLRAQFKQTSCATPVEGFKHKFYTEQVFYWLRKSADELISLIYLLSFHKTKRKYQKKLK